MTSTSHQDALERLKSRGFTNRELAEQLGVHYNNFSRMRDKDGRLLRHWDFALRWFEHTLDVDLAIVRSAASCVDQEDLSPIIEASVGHVNTRWNTKLDTLITDPELAPGVSTATHRVRFVHASSDEARREQLRRDPVSGSRLWKMQLDVQGVWRPAEFRSFHDSDMIQLGATEEDVFKPLNMWAVEAFTSYGWSMIGVFDAVDVNEAIKAAQNQMRERAASIMQWRTRRAG